MRARTLAYALSAIAAVALVGAAAQVGRDGARAHAAPHAASNDAGAGDAGRRGSAASVGNGGNANAGAGDWGYVAELRLVDDVRAARSDTPRSPAGAAVLAAHWRKMRLPWLPSDPQRRELTTSIALRTSSTETQWSMPATGGKAWTPDARVWNMNEGSFDQRESLVAEVPSSITYTLSVPVGGMFEFAPGTVNDTERAILFRATVRDPGAQAGTAVCETTLDPRDARKWAPEVKCDLSKHAGQTVELVLRVEPVGDVVPRVRRPRPAHKGDAGPPVDPAEAQESLLERAGTTVALWGNPTVYKRAPLRRNVLWIVIDALRPDVIASFHDDEADARALAAPKAPLEALLPKVPGLLPNIDALAAKGARFVHAYSAGAWTRPGTLAMLSGARSSELGVATLPWVIPAEDVVRFYASEPPLLPLLLRKQGYATRAFVNNYFMVGYAPVGVDVGFERADDHRYRTRDTFEITQSALEWMKKHTGEQFFMFANYNSPHEPWEPPKEFLPRLGDEPKDHISRLYMAEAAKDDEAVGQLMRALEDAKIADKTIVVLTADHGETLSAAHDGVGLDKMRLRYHHAASNYEETSRIPILIVAPGLLPAGAVKARVRNVDIVPTLLELLAMEPNAKVTGSSLVALARGAHEAEERVVVTEGRGTRGIIAGKYRLLVHDIWAAPKEDDDAEGTKKAEHRGNEELFDLETDPGERVNLARTMPDVVKEMRARLAAAVKNVPVAGSSAALAGGAINANANAGSDAGGASAPSKVYLRFAGKAASHRVRGQLTVDAGKTMRLVPVGLPGDAFKASAGKVEVAFDTIADSIVGFDVSTEPPGSPLKWAFFYDDVALEAGQVFGGMYGLRAPALVGGVTSDEARRAASAVALPYVDPVHDLGLFVARDAAGDVAASSESVTMEGAEEMNRLLREWGYARGGGKDDAK